MVYNSITKYDYERISYIENSDHDSFKILNGKYSGTILTYGKIALTEPTTTDSDEATLSYEFNINETPLDGDLSESVEFQNYAGDMLQVIIEEALEEKHHIGEKPVDTNSHFEKSYN
jgi:hypothetical protein